MLLTRAAEAMTSSCGRVAILTLLALCSAVVVTGNPDNATCSLPAPSNRVAAEKRLMTCLMDLYNPDVRPAHNATEAVNVHFNMKYIQVVEVNTKANVLRTKAWIEKRWVDPQLKWNPADFEGITAIRIPAKKIWTPDVILYNNLDIQGAYIMDVLAVVSSNGSVMWMPHAMLTSHCVMNMRHFPHDRQTCFLVFGSWTYDVSELTLKLNDPPNPAFSYAYNNWHVQRVTATTHDIPIAEASDFSHVIYTLEIIRTSAYYGETLILPAMILSILTLAMFFIPAATGERLVFGVGLLLASVLLLKNVEDAVPGDIGEVPLIVAYLAFDQVMLTAGIILSIIVYNCHYRNVKRGSVPECLKTVFLGRLSRLLCVPAEPYTRLPHGDDADLDMSPFPYDSEPTTDAASAAHRDRALDATLQDIRKYLKICAAQATSGGDSGSHHQVVLNEWIQLARVVDRLLFVVFLTITVITLVFTAAFH